MTMTILPRKVATPLRPAAAMALLCLALAGCNGAGETSGASLEQSVATPQSQMVALASTTLLAQTPSQAIVALPAEAGAIASVRAHGYVNGFRQDILLKGSPLRSVPNSLTILARTSRQATLDEATPLFKPTEATIRSELGQQFPHITMQVVERSSSNTYGPYGLALGRGAGTVHCIYMWQWIDENRLPAEAGVSGPLSVRVRLCQADTTFDAMAALVDKLTFSRDAALSSDAGGIVAGPDDVSPVKPARRKPVKHLAAHRARPVAEARRDLRGDASSPAGIPSFTPPPIAAASASPPLAMDLPPQAYLGPKANATRQN